ncbi:MAG: hypothetical protein R2847_12185 [Bacteroidia bacterium]
MLAEAKKKKAGKSKKTETKTKPAAKVSGNGAEEKKSCSYGEKVKECSCYKKAYRHTAERCLV